ncbi:MAG TPA: TlyA family RNA methyltransferase [Patescibacteria group bacterium]|jgi:23S rRNA (cytidine1920-2'-O)/16S rRNA (cytidine1409-2'-O)-methyltransferase|nr:TlyA family RNA methyltransferase [Patescibacteria group bacterium]
MKQKIRFDCLLHMQYPEFSRRTIQQFIVQGHAFINGAVLCKPGQGVCAGSQVFLDAEKPKFVSRAGFKLEAALHAWSIVVEGMVCMDAGISTGGFTDCLLQRGAQRVYGIDVGHGQLDPKIAYDDRVILLEKTNLRTLTSLAELVDIVTLDLSFISVVKVMEAVERFLKNDGTLLILIKPQFEVEGHLIGRGGIVKNDEVRNTAVQKVIAGVQVYGFIFQGVMQSPLSGADGNIEFLAHFKKIKKL